MRSSSALIAALLLTLAACVAPTPSPSSSGPDVAQPAPAAPQEPGAQPAPSTAVPPSPTTPAGTVALDYSCKTDADCAVKNVGNCCGYYPACVNVDSPTDPKGVQAACAKKGMMSVCGFADISSCSCKQGTCEAAPAALVQ